MHTFSLRPMPIQKPRSVVYHQMRTVLDVRSDIIKAIGNQTIHALRLDLNDSPYFLMVEQLFLENGTCAFDIWHLNLRILTTPGTEGQYKIEDQYDHETKLSDICGLEKYQQTIHLHEESNGVVVESAYVKVDWHAVQYLLDNTLL